MKSKIKEMPNKPHMLPFSFALLHEHFRQRSLTLSSFPLPPLGPPHDRQTEQL